MAALEFNPNITKTNKKTPQPFYDQRMLGHYYGQHMLCGNSSMVFQHLAIIQHLDNAFSNTIFDYTEYCNRCYTLDIQPAPIYKPMTTFIGIVRVFEDKKNPPYLTIIPTDSPEIPRFMTVTHRSSFCINYEIDLSAYDHQHAWEQLVSICKEYF